MSDPEEKQKSEVELAFDEYFKNLTPAEKLEEYQLLCKIIEDSDEGITEEKKSG